MSVLFSYAAAQWRQLRADYEIVRENAYALAEHDTNGNLLNRDGKAADVDPYSLFIGPEARARKYASEELLEHWETHPRITFAAFERQSLETDWSVA